MAIRAIIWDMGNVINLIHMQITLEYQLDPDGLLVPFAGSTEQARYVVYWHSSGFSCYYRHDLPERLRAQLASLDPALAFQEPGEISRLLEGDRLNQNAGIFKSYYFPRPQASGDFQDAQLHKECFIINVLGEPVAWAWSERSNAQCAEVAVETRPNFRRRGYARQVTAAWAAGVMSQGKVAFFSHSVDNLASEALARSLGLKQFALAAAFD